MTPLLRCDPRMGATTVSLMDGHIWIWAGKYTVGIRTRVRSAVGPLFEMLHIYMVWLGFAKTHTYPVWGMTTLRQFRSSGPMRAPCSRRSDCCFQLRRGEAYARLRPDLSLPSWTPRRSSSSDIDPGRTVIDIGAFPGWPILKNSEGSPQWS